MTCQLDDSVFSGNKRGLLRYNKQLLSSTLKFRVLGLTPLAEIAVIRDPRLRISIENLPCLSHHYKLKMWTECHEWCHQRSFSIHAFAAQSSCALIFDLTGSLWTGETKQQWVTHYKIMCYWKTPIRGPGFAPMACLATATPLPLYPVCICTPSPPPLSPQHFSLILLPPLRSASALTCILRGLFWHICPRLVMPLWFWASVWMLSMAAPADSLSELLTGNRAGPPVARIAKSDLSTQETAACLDARPNGSQIPGFC